MAAIWDNFTGYAEHKQESLYAKYKDLQSKTITDMIKNKIHWGVRRLSPYYSPVFPSLPGPLQ